MYIIINKSNCAAGLSSARLKIEVPIWRDDAAWKIAAMVRQARGNSVTEGLLRSKTISIGTSTRFRANRMPKRIHVVRQGSVFYGLNCSRRELAIADNTFILH